MNGGDVRGKGGSLSASPLSSVQLQCMCQLTGWPLLRSLEPFLQLQRAALPGIRTRDSLLMTTVGEAFGYGLCADPQPGRHDEANTGSVMWNPCMSMPLQWHCPNLQDWRRTLPPEDLASQQQQR